MSGHASGAPEHDLSAGHGGEAPHGHYWQNLVAALVCIGWNGGFLLLSLGLPAGHSRGDVGPGSLPIQVAVFGTAVSAVYLVQVLRGVDLGGTHGRVDIARVSGLMALFVAVCLGANWMGLALCLGIGAGVATLLFPGEKPLVRAAATGAGFWAIAYLVFGKLLALPLP